VVFLGLFWEINIPAASRGVFGLLRSKQERRKRRGIRPSAIEFRDFRTTIPVWVAMISRSGRIGFDQSAGEVVQDMPSLSAHSPCQTFFGLFSF
jgi:hypothetical protein